MSSRSPSWSAALAVALALCSCRHAAETTPRVLLEDPEGNYVRVFETPVPARVTVVNSALVAYSPRPGVVTTDDFEFELLVPPSWVEEQAARLMLREGNWAADVERRRRAGVRPWYAPKPPEAYVLWRDLSSVGYVHMLVDREKLGDGRVRVFVSKH